MRDPQTIQQTSLDVCAIALDFNACPCVTASGMNHGDISTVDRAIVYDASTVISV